MLSKCPYVLGPQYQHVLLRGPGLLFPQQQGSAKHHTLGTRDKRMVSASFPAAARPSSYIPQSQWPLTTSSSSSSSSLPPHHLWVRLRMGEGSRAAAGRGSKRLHCAANSWRTAVRLWLSKREELRETGTKARQLHPLGFLGLPTTSPCFSKPYVHPLPHPVSK